EIRKTKSLISQTTPKRLLSNISSPTTAGVGKAEDGQHSGNGVKETDSHGNGDGGNEDGDEESGSGSSVEKSLQHWQQLVSGGKLLCKKYNICKSIKFYDTLGKIGKIQLVQSVNQIKKYLQILAVTNNQLQHYDVLKWFGSQKNTKEKKRNLSGIKINPKDIIDALHKLALDLSWNLLSSIHKKAHSITDDVQWNELTNDLLDVRSQLFPFVPKERITMQFFQIVLTTCHFEFVRYFIFFYYFYYYLNFHRFYLFCLVERSLLPLPKKENRCKKHRHLYQQTIL
ncbi:hypothetical protein RFI_18573, partial [Reticulomyxa filosa]